MTNKLKILLAFLLIVTLCDLSAQNRRNRNRTITGWHTKDSIVRNGYTLISINLDSTFNKEVKTRLEETFFKVYPQMAARFNKNTAKKVTFIIDPGYNGVAGTSGGRVVYSPAWFAKHPGDIDVVTHEVMHIVQDYGNTPGPGWLTEGIADYARYKYGVDNAGDGWSLPALKPEQSYTNAYRVTARFLAWLEDNKDKKIIDKLDAVMRDHTYTDDTWKKLTGKTVDELWAEYMKSEGVTAKAEPPATWKEHWFEHVQTVKRVYYDNDVAVYYDDDIDLSMNWPFSFVRDVWKYTKKTYGTFGDEGRLYAIFHAGKYSGGHPATYLDASHDNRNTIDCGSHDSKAWVSKTGNDKDIVTHEIGHIVEGASYNIRESPAFRIWGDSKWMEIYIYDVYVGLGMTEDTQRWYDLMMKGSDNFPRPDTHWFKDWFYPIWKNHGGSETLNRFFKLLSENFPTKMEGNVKTYTRRMNWGEFVHFWSGAAQTDLNEMANLAFGSSTDRDKQLQQAKKDFPLVKYETKR